MKTNHTDSRERARNLANQGPGCAVLQLDVQCSCYSHNWYWKGRQDDSRRRVRVDQWHKHISRSTWKLRLAEPRPSRAATNCSFSMWHGGGDSGLTTPEPFSCTWP